MSVHIIDQRSDDHSSGLAARKLWRELYKLTNAHTWNDLDSFLCDLRIFENMVDDTYKTEGFILSFWWVWDKSGYTWVWNFDPRESEYYKITIDRSTVGAYKIVIEDAS